MKLLTVTQNLGNKETFSLKEKNLDQKDKITLKMPKKEELTTEKQLQELLAAKQQEEEEKRKQKESDIKSAFWYALVLFVFCGMLSLGIKGVQIYNEHLVNNHSFWVIFKDFFTLTRWNANFWGWLILSLFGLFGIFYTRKELKKLNQSENTV